MALAHSNHSRVQADASVADTDSCMRPLPHWARSRARNAATRFISPTKTLEYLAAGRPVVSTSIHDVVHPYGDEGLVLIADEPGAFAAAIDTCLTLDKVAHRARCDAWLRSTSWDQTWSAMRALVHEREQHHRHARSTTDHTTRQETQHV